MPGTDHYINFNHGKPFILQMYIKFAIPSRLLYRKFHKDGLWEYSNTPTHFVEGFKQF